MRTRVFMVFGLFLVATAALAQDPATVGPDIYKCLLDNERVRVCEVTFKPGAQIGMHSHPAHIVYVITPGRLRITAKGKEPVDVDFVAGQAVWSDPDVHSAVNIGTTELRGLVVELKEAPRMMEKKVDLERGPLARRCAGDTPAQASGLRTGGRSRPRSL